MSKARLRAAGVAAALALVPASASAQAQFNGNTTGQPTYNRVVTGAPPTTLSGTGTAANLQAFHFRVRGAGNFQFDTIRDSHPDTFITLYSGLFNPGAPLAGALAADDPVKSMAVIDAVRAAATSRAASR